MRGCCRGCGERPSVLAPANGAPTAQLSAAGRAVVGDGARVSAERRAVVGGGARGSSLNARRRARDTQFTSVAPVLPCTNVGWGCLHRECTLLILSS